METKFLINDLVELFRFNKDVSFVDLKPEAIVIFCTFAQYLHDKFGIDRPFITSAYRTPAKNKSVGGVENSAHTRGLAIDIFCKKSSDRFKIVAAALSAGIPRIGIAKTYIHLDVDTDKPYPVIFLY